MNRRNFVGNLLLAGAAFSILPSAKLTNRIWVPNRTLIVPSVGSIWDNYYITRYDTQNPPVSYVGKFGDVRVKNGSLWYKSEAHWWKLDKKLWVSNKNSDPYPNVIPSIHQRLRERFGARN